MPLMRTTIFVSCSIHGLTPGLPPLSSLPSNVSPSMTRLTCRVICASSVPLIPLLRGWLKAGGLGVAAGRGSFVQALLSIPFRQLQESIRSAAAIINNFFIILLFCVPCKDITKNPSIKVSNRVKMRQYQLIIRQNTSFPLSLPCCRQKRRSPPQSKNNIKIMICCAAHDGDGL